MKQLLAVFSLVALAATTVMGAPLCTSLIHTQLTEGAMNALPECSVDGYTFDNFGLSIMGASGVSVYLASVTDEPGKVGLGFQISGPMASSGWDIAFRYRVYGAPMYGAWQDWKGNNVDFTEHACIDVGNIPDVNGSCNPKTTNLLVPPLEQTGMGGVAYQAFIPPGPQTSVYILKDIQAQGNASFSGFVNSTSTTIPEPASALACGMGLIALAGLSRWFRKK